MLSFLNRPSIDTIKHANTLWSEGKYAEAVAKYQSLLDGEQFVHTPTGDDIVGLAFYNLMTFYLHQNNYEKAFDYLTKVSPESAYQHLMKGVYLSRMHPKQQGLALSYLKDQTDVKFVDALIHRAQIKMTQKDVEGAVRDFQAANELLKNEQNWKQLFVLSCSRQDYPSQIPTLSFSSQDVNYVPLYLEEDLLRAYSTKKPTGDGFKNLAGTKDLFVRMISNCRDSKLQMEILDHVLSEEKQNTFLYQMFHESRSLTSTSNASGRLKVLYDLRETLREREKSVRMSLIQVNVRRLTEEIKLNPLDAEAYYLRSREYIQANNMLTLHFNLDSLKTRRDKDSKLDYMLQDAKAAVRLNPLNKEYWKWLACAYYLFAMQVDIDSTTETNTTINGDVKEHPFINKALETINTAIALGLDQQNELQYMIDAIYVERAKVLFRLKQNYSEKSSSFLYPLYCNIWDGAIETNCNAVKTELGKAHVLFVRACSLFFPSRNLAKQSEMLHAALDHYPESVVLRLAVGSIEILEDKLEQAQLRFLTTPVDPDRAAKINFFFLRKFSLTAIAGLYSNRLPFEACRMTLVNSEFVDMQDSAIDDFFRAIQFTGKVERACDVTLTWDHVPKEKLLEAIKKISDPQLKINVLVQSLSKKTLLGQYFHVARGPITDPSLSKGTLNQIIILLLKAIDDFRELTNDEFKLSKQTKAVLQGDPELMTALLKGFPYLHSKLSSAGGVGTVKTNSKSEKSTSSKTRLQIVVDQSFDEQFASRGRFAL